MFYRFPAGRNNGRRAVFRVQRPAGKSIRKDRRCAVIMALDLATRRESYGPVYDTRGLLVFGGDDDW